MPRDKRALSIAVSDDDQAVKPSPPDDLWEQMDRLHREVNLPIDQNDPGFTDDEYAKRYGININAARSRLNRLTEMGRMSKGWSMRGGKKRRVYQPGVVQ